MFVYLFKNLFNKYLLSNHYVPGSVLSVRNTEEEGRPTKYMSFWSLDSGRGEKNQSIKLEAWW